MSSRYPTLSASVPPPASVIISSPIRGLAADLLDAPAPVALACLTARSTPADPASASASEFFAIFDAEE
jgi:hypothetical protein